jgi:signal transduction histidine kinase
MQRDRADAAEKYKIQLENFIDMICHEIRNPYVAAILEFQSLALIKLFRLNGIFGNTDLIFYYLEAIDEILLKHKLARNPDSEPSVPSSPTSTSPLLNTILNIAPKSPPSLTRSVSAPAQPAPAPAPAPAPPPSTTKLSLSSEIEKKPEETLLYLLEQVMVSAKTIQKCADHQKCMTDDVLQLSRLRSHKLTITNSYYNPYDTVVTAMTIFKPQAESKVKSLNFI